MSRFNPSKSLPVMKTPLNVSFISTEHTSFFRSTFEHVPKLCSHMDPWTKSVRNGYFLKTFRNRGSELSKEFDYSVSSVCVLGHRDLRDWRQPRHHSMQHYMAGLQRDEFWTWRNPRFRNVLLCPGICCSSPPNAVFLRDGVAQFTS